MNRDRATWRPRQDPPFVLVVAVLALLLAVLVQQRDAEDVAGTTSTRGVGVLSFLIPLPTKTRPYNSQRRQRRNEVLLDRFRLLSALGGSNDDTLTAAGGLIGDDDTTLGASLLRKDKSTIVIGPDEDDRALEARSVVCGICHQSFRSRNALFRHLRGQQQGDVHEEACGTTRTNASSLGCVPNLSNASTVNMIGPTSDGQSTRVPFRVAVQFGYHHPQDLLIGGSTGSDESAPLTVSAAERAASLIQQSLLHPLKTDSVAGDEASETDGPSQAIAAIMNVTMTSVTQSTSAKLRAAGLRQEDDCSAAHDVLVLSGDAAFNVSLTTPIATKAELDSMMEQDIVERIFNRVLEPSLRLDAIKFLEKPLHAERSCSQYIYHYLMPASWLADPENEMSTWVGKERLATDSRQNGESRHRAASNSTAASRQRRPPALVRLKQALRSMESPRLDASSTSLKEVESKPDSRGADSRRRRVAAGRFGGLAYKSRQAFHNYCDQQLMGAISPNHDVVWRCVDRARIVDFVTTRGDDVGLGNETSIVLEFRGDAFLRHQIRTMVGTALSMANGWLPMDATVPLSTSPDHIVAPLPCAPAGRLYLAGTRFHFEELSNSGKPLFDPSAAGRVHFASKHRSRSHRNVTNGQWIQRLLLDQKERVNEQMVESEWLTFTEARVCPAARTSLAAAANDPSLGSLSGSPLSPSPEEFNNVLSHLRNIVATRSWPETTAARSSVIRVASEEGGETKSMGSFTVVNPSFVGLNLHLGNVLFPELVNDVFALEQALSEQKRELVTSANGDGSVQITSQASGVRPPSTHCAINCNAQFTPHVDSGRGTGQSMSMIVGLGDYAGGELMVEGTPHDIRYRAVEFDGWKLRHWTRPFQGERFSLVWFTPATSVWIPMRNRNSKLIIIMHTVTLNGGAFV